MFLLTVGVRVCVSSRAQIHVVCKRCAELMFRTAAGK